MIKLRNKSKSLSKNTNKREKKLTNNKLKNKFKELLKKLNGVINLRELMSINHYGLEIDRKFKINNIKIFIKLFLRNLLILQHGAILELKVKLISRVCYLFPKELIMINLINFMRKNLKLNSLLREF